MLAKRQAKISKVMREFKRGELRSGSKEGPVVKKRGQAIAIALAQAKNLKESQISSFVPVSILPNAKEVVKLFIPVWEKYGPEKKKKTLKIDWNAKTGDLRLNGKLLKKVNDPKQAQKEVKNLLDAHYIKPELKKAYIDAVGSLATSAAAVVSAAVNKAKTGSNPNSVAKAYFNQGLDDFSAARERIKKLNSLR